MARAFTQSEAWTEAVRQNVCSTIRNVKVDTMLRDDLSERLIHLTRGDSDQAAADNFVSILQERKLRGGIRDIRGRYPCVCFSEAPVSKLAHILADDPNKMRYKPFGVMVGKKWLFERGGRPVIYQPESEFELLHESQQFRHVRYNPFEKIDVSWEREWRIQTDELNFAPEEVTLVVPTRDWEKWLQDQHSTAVGMAGIILQGFTGIVPEFNWHFVVLEDLGVPVEGVRPPDSNAKGSRVIPRITSRTRIDNHPSGEADAKAKQDNDA